MRISFANVVFFALHFLLLIGMKKETDRRIFLHTGCWGIKFFMWVGALIGEVNDSLEAEEGVAGSAVGDECTFSQKARRCFGCVACQ